MLRRRSGYTLIETIAAVALIGLAVAALLPSVAGRTDQTRQGELVDRLGDFHRRACLLSLREGPIRLRVDQERSAVIAEGAVGEVMRFDVGNAEIRILEPADRREREAFVIDRLGRSADYLLLVRDASWSALLRIEGRTGRLAGEEPAS